MKKFILLFVAVVVSSIAFSQKVTQVGFINQDKLVALDGAKFNVPENVKISLPIVVFFQNTGADLNSGDTLYLYMELNNKELMTIKVSFPKTLESDSGSAVQLPLQISTSLFEANNHWCFSFTKAIRSGVEEIPSDNPCCVDFTVNIVGIATINTPAVNVYPNPAKDNICIENANNSILYFYNTLGQLVRKIDSSSDVMNVNTSNFNNGIYILKIQKGESVQTKKIQIIK